MNPPPIVASVIYYRPLVDDLARLLDSLQGRVAAAVFVDGPFDGVSSDVKSIRYEREAIERFAETTPTYAAESRVWADEAEKRTFAAQVAYQLFSDVASHLLVIDSDEALETDVPIPPGGQLGVARIIDPHKERGGATMIRLHELSAGLRWGPAHFEVSNYGLRYATPHCLPDLAHSFVIRHYGLPVKPHAGYQRYNDQLRMRREAAGRLGEGDLAIPSWAYQSREQTIFVHPPQG